MTIADSSSPTVGRTSRLIQRQIFFDTTQAGRCKRAAAFNDWRNRRGRDRLSWTVRDALQSKDRGGRISWIEATLPCRAVPWQRQRCQDLEHVRTASGYAAGRRAVSGTAQRSISAQRPATVSRRSLSFARGWPRAPKTTYCFPAACCW